MVFPAAKSVKVTATFSAVVAVPGVLMATTPRPLAAGGSCNVGDVPEMGKSVTLLLAVALVKTTVFPIAEELANPVRDPFKGAVVVAKLLLSD